jgi:hypothetical protein
MAGSIAVTTSNEGRARKYRIVWTSDASGDVSGNTFPVARGELIQAAYTPGAGGVQPTNLYDVTLLDPNGADALAGTGANLSNAVATAVVPVISTYFRRLLQGGAYTPVVANAGNAKQGTIDLWVRPL